MRYHFKKRALAGGFLILLLLTVGIVYFHNRAVYTASLDSRMFIAGAVGIVASLEPAKLSSRPERLAASAVYEGLVYYDEKNQTVKPAIAKKWKYSRDGKSLTFYLNKKIKFHNGKEVTAGDVKASWENNFSSTKDWYNLSLFLPIVGAAEKVKGSLDVSGIQVLDDYTLKIHFLKPDNVFIYVLTNPMFWVMDTAIYTEKEDAVAPGTGPYIFKQIKDNNVLLLRNEKYYRGCPRLASIEVIAYQNDTDAFKDYKSGKLDYLDTVPVQEIKTVQNDKQYNSLFISKPLLEIYALGFNNNREPYSRNYLLRRALNYAIDRKAIMEIAGYPCTASKGVIPEGLAAYSKNVRGYSYNPERARTLLAEAGYPLGEGLPVLTLSYNSDPGHKAIAEAISGQLAQLSIIVQLQAMDWTYYQKQLTQMAVSFFRVGWQADYPDADNFLYSMFHSSQMGISNYFGYYNPQVDKLLEQSRAETDRNKRLEILARAEKIIIDDAPCLWLYQKKSAKMIGPQVTGLKTDNMEMIDWYQVELHKPVSDKKPVSNTKK